MLIPSIDLMGGKIVQLVQGEKKALEFDDFEEWILRFANYPLVQLIDLDVAISAGNNRALLERLRRNFPSRWVVESAHWTMRRKFCREEPSGSSSARCLFTRARSTWRRRNNSGKDSVPIG